MAGKLQENFWESVFLFRIFAEIIMKTMLAKYLIFAFIISIFFASCKYTPDSTGDNNNGNGTDTSKTKIGATVIPKAGSVFFFREYVTYHDYVDSNQSWDVIDSIANTGLTEYGKSDVMRMITISGQSTVGWYLHYEPD